MRLFPTGAVHASRAALALFLTAAIAQAGPPPPKPTAPRPSPPTALDVTVQDPRGKPVAGALVIAGGGGGLVPTRREGRTDERGRVRIDGLPRLPWDVAVQARGLAPKRLARVTDGKPLVVRLEPGGVVTGVVRDGLSREPVGGARVWVMTRLLGVPADRWDPDADRIDTTADARGRFRLEGLGAAPTTVEATAPGFGHGWLRAVRPGDAIELFLLPGATLLGTVRDEAGKPVRGAVVRALGEVSAEYVPLTERTDTAGRFAFHGLGAGRYTVVAREGSRAPAIASASVEDRGESALDLTLGEGGFVTGRLLDAGDRPLEGRVRVAEVDERILHPALYDLMQAEAGPDGRFVLGPVPFGPLAVEAFAPGYAPHSLETALDTRSRSADLGDVVLDTGLRIRGVVRTRDGTPIGGATVLTYARSESATRPPTTVSDEDGTFALGGLQPGNMPLHVSAPGYAPLQQSVAAGADDLELVLDPGGTVIGSVVDAKGQPVDGATLFAQTEETGENRGHGFATADEGGGRFTLRDLRSGRYVIQARAPKHGEAAAQAVVGAGRTTDVGAVRLRPGGTVRGTVVDAAGEPVAGASVRVETGTPRALDSIAQTDGRGAFEIAGVPPGQFHVAARHPAFAPGRAPAEIESETDTVDVRVVLPRGGRVEGVVRRRDGEPFAGGQVIVLAGPAPLGWNAGGSRVTVADDGSFALEHAPAGRARVLLLMPATTTGVPAHQSILQREVDVLDGETTRLDITTREVLVSGRVTRAGGPAPGVTVILQPRRSGTVFGVAPLAATARGAGPQPLVGTTREDGRYELLLFEPGEYQATRRTPEGATGPLRAASQPADRPGFMHVEVPDVPAYSLDFVLGASPVSGIVIDADTGQPVARALVNFLGGGSFGRSETGADGRFSFEVEPAEGRLLARAESYAETEERLAVGETGAQDLRIELRRGAMITGRIEDGAGRPRGDVPIRAQLEGAEASGPGGFAVSLPDGRFRMTGLREGSYSLAAGTETVGFGQRHGVQAGTSDAVITIRPAARANVRVVDAAGAPVARAFVRVVTCGGSPIALPTASAPTDATGVATVALPEGACVLEARGEPGVGRTMVDARAGAQVSIEIVLESPEPPVKLPPP